MGNELGNRLGRAVDVMVELLRAVHRNALKVLFGNLIHDVQHALPGRLRRTCLGALLR